MRETIINDIESNYDVCINNIRRVMIHFGFDFSLIGTIYIYELLLDIKHNSEIAKNLYFPTISKLAERYSVKAKSINRAIRWSVKNAFLNGYLGKVPFFSKSKKVPSTKKVLSYIFNFYIETSG